ncbi:hypothetical protein CCP3SC1AL1_1420009 [Gammaproteobacteria bacterium]
MLLAVVEAMAGRDVCVLFNPISLCQRAHLTENWPALSLKLPRVVD